MHHHLVLLDEPSLIDDISDATGGFQAKLDDPICNVSQLQGGEFAAFIHHGIFNDLTQARDNRSHKGRLHSVGQSRNYHLQSLCNQLAGAIDVGAPLKFHKNYRYPNTGRRTHPINKGYAIECALQGKSDQSLYLLWGKTRRLRQDGHTGVVDIRVDINGQLLKRLVPQDQHRNCTGEDQHFVL